MAAEGEGLADQLDIAQFRVVNGLSHAEVLHLRVLEHLIHRVNRPARHPGRVKQGDEALAGVVLRVAVDGRVEGVAIVGACGAVGIARVVEKLRRLDGLAEALPDGLAGRGNVDVAVRRLEHAGRDAGRMVVAGLRRHLLFQQPARRLEIQHENLCLQQRRLHPLALAGHFAFQQRGQDAQGARQPGAQVGNGHAGAHRPLAGQPGDGHQPAHALRDLVEARAAVIRPVLAESGNAAVNQTRVDRVERLVIHPQAVLDVRTVVLHHHVGFFDQSLEQLQPLRRLQVQGDAFLVAMQVLEIRAQPRTAQGGVAFHRLGQLDLDGIGAPVRQLAHAGRTGAHAGEVQNGETGQGQGAVVRGHDVSLES